MWFLSVQLFRRPLRKPALTLTAASGEITAVWTAPYNNGAAITGYTLTITNGEDYNYVASVCGDATRYTFARLKNGIEYTVMVKAENSAGAGAVISKTAVPSIPSVSPSPTTYQAFADSGENGTIKVSSVKPVYGQKVTITTDTSVGYKADKVTVTGADGQQVSVTGNGNGTVNPAGYTRRCEFAAIIVRFIENVK